MTAYYCMPKVSIIIPIYGVEKYIKRCAESLFSQTLDDMEFIFIDDCTPDKSMEILASEIEKNRQRFAEMNWTVRTERMTSNNGLPAVRRHGINLCTGDYVIHCDSDDWVCNDIYHKLYNKAISEDLDIVWCAFYRSDGINHTFFSDEKQPYLMQGPLWNKMVRRSIYTENEIIYPTANKAEDGALMMQLSFLSKSRGYLDEPLYYYFINRASICGQIDETACLRKLEEECSNVDIRVEFLKKHQCEKKYQKDIVLWKYTARNNLLPLLKQKKYRELWKGTYPEIERYILYSHHIPIKIKLGYVKKILGL